MDRSTDPSTVEARLARLEEAHAALLERTATLEAENRALRGPDPVLSAPVPAVPAPAADGTPVAVPVGLAVGRRHLLRTGLAAAGAAATGAVLLDGAPVAAADGDPLLLGEANTSTTATTLTAGGQATSGLTVLGGPPVELPDGPTTPPRDGAAVVVEGGDRLRAGLLAVADTGTGIRTHSRRGTALQVDTETGQALIVRATGAPTTGSAVEIANAKGTWGLKVDAPMGEAIRAEGGGRGILAISKGVGAAVYAAAWADGPALEADGPAIFHGSSGPNLWLRGQQLEDAPGADGKAHEAGEVMALEDGRVLLCVASGTPGVWRILGGPDTAGSFHVLPVPARALDTRPGSLPSVGTKEPLDGSSVRAIDLNAAGEIVPVDATAVLLTVLLVNATAGAGNFTVWAGAQAKPIANTLVWGGNAGRFTTSAVTAVTAGGVQVHASLKTHLVLDVVGYYR